MYCTNCGRKIKKNIKTCPYCGSYTEKYIGLNKKDILPEAPEEEWKDALTEEALGFAKPDSQYIGSELVDPVNGAMYRPKGDQGSSKKDLKVLRIYIGAAAIVIIAVFIFLFAFRKGDEAAFTNVPKNAIEIDSDTTGNETVVYNTQGVVLHRLKNINGALISLDKTAALLTGYIDTSKGIPSYMNNCYVSRDKIIEFDKNINGIIMSDNGNFIVYGSVDENSENLLYLYDVDKGKARILDESKENIFIPTCTSPDGRIISYVTTPMEPYATTHEMSRNSFIIRNGGEPEAAIENTLIFGLSDNGEYIYYVNYTDMGIYVKGNGNITKLSEFKPDSLITFMGFTRDYSEVMFTLDGVTYISSRGSSPKELTRSEISAVIIPRMCASGISYITNGKIFGFDTFKNKVIQCKDNYLRYINDNYEAEDIGIVGADCKAYVSGDGNSLMYSTGGEAKILYGLKDGLSVDKNHYYIDNFIVSEDLSEIYYTYEGDLNYIDGDSNPKFLGEGVSELFWSADGKTALIVKNKVGGKGKLYYSSSGNAIRMVESIDYVSEITASNYGTAFRGSDGTSFGLYYNTGGINMKKIIAYE